MTAYRPIIVAKPAELGALEMIGSTLGAKFKPVLVIPPRAWNWEDDTWAKTLEQHCAGIPGALEKSVSGVPFFVDLSLLDSDDPIFGAHPLWWLVDQARTRGLDATPVLSPESSPEHVAAANQVHAAYSPGIAIRLQPENWPSIDRTVIERLLARLEAAESEIDLFLELGDAAGPVAERAAIAEVGSLVAEFDFRSISVGVSAFPDLAGVARGVSEFSRSDLEVFRAVRDGVAIEIGFADTAIQRADQVDLGVDPKLLTISGILRYTTAKHWLVAKGGLFKASGGRSEGGAALIPALNLLVGHPEYRTPIDTETDDWIDEVLAGAASPGNPQTWRKWGTLRHLRVTASVVAS